MSYCGQGGIEDTTLRCRRDAEGKLKLVRCNNVTYLTACVRACMYYYCMMAARIYAAAWSEEEKVKLDETKLARFQVFRQQAHVSKTQRRQL